MGRWSNERRAEEAAKAASRANIEAKAPELPLEPAGDQDASEGDRPPPRNEPRRLAMEEILIARGTPTEPEPEAKPAAKPELKPAPVTAPEPAAVATQPAVAPAATPVEPVAATAPVPIVKVKVDGQEFDVSQAEVDAAGGINAYQRDKASENRLAKANQTLAETRRTQAQIAEWIQQQAPKQPTLTDDQFIQSQVDIIRFGTPEDSAVALREVMHRTNPRVDTQVITQQAVSQMMKIQALDNFKKEFQDVITNSILMRAAVSLETERGPQTGPQTDWNVFFRTIGNEVRSGSGRPSQLNPSAAQSVTATTDPTSPVDKEARKASIVNLPTAAARAALPVDEKPESREDTLNLMRKKRGIPIE